MIDDLKEEDIVARVGGRFKLATLILKRQLQLMHGGRGLVDIKATHPMQLVIEEIKRGMISLNIKEELKEVVNPPPFEATIRKAIPRGDHGQAVED
ncbi:MAG: DNA-directed RNA polymerase subunit omega [Gemmatales bacterium]|nr:DNA-directed RNA polymerase subunit omega [Gemmatales bacterium]MCS7160425.1 DNA-directed RNA polymerase subunit omega [Gemmatales bacterium]MDW8175625.1 DNA-directed RNA polymerase subunit omega [Gemmatales bacterium]MDW8222503.1 DNA-directed RNA polymerase subunit omega [Gemmatales bacterium]